ncbi:MAG TPA: SPFH domain-containing protein [Isosphaeraceae bacterium]|jgi:regulator of protease activity HflC (stomatin/prohibitin superfamily)|nr:SPFH domain-containing protein [Isosphaeraceae bacterium]
MNTRGRNLLINGAVALAALFLIGYLGLWQWSVCRIDVPAGYSLLLRYKGPWPFGSATQAPEGTLAKTDEQGRPLQVGVLEAMPGPGRHFYSPLEYETKLVPDIVIEPGKLGVVTSKVGKPLPAGTYLADNPGERGIVRRVLTPGRYRMNSYAFDVKIVGVDECVGSSGGMRRRENDPLLIPAGYVGVVTNKAPNPLTHEDQGIQNDVLQPGIYFLNPAEKRVDIVSVGFNETTMMVETEKGSDGKVLRSSTADVLGDRMGKAGQGDPVYAPGKGIEFPSNDGFSIHMDYTAIWGILPDQAPDVVRHFGTINDVRQKVIEPQIGSICRLHGSKRGAVDLLVGDSREAFQTDTAEELERVLEGKNLTLLFGLTRHIYVPAAVREPLQKAKIADELKLTRDQEQLTAKAEADLTEAKAKVVLEERRTKAETTKLVAELTAEGEKKAKEIEADTEKLRAEIDARTAKISAQIQTTMGQAEAKRTELANEAEADLYRQYVQVLGGPEAYNRYVFAEGLPLDIRVGIFYAGPGTFWTDLKGFEQTMLGKIANETTEPKARPRSTMSPLPTAGNGERR